MAVYEYGRSIFNFLIGIASNLDNAGVGIAYGIRKIKFRGSTILSSHFLVFIYFISWLFGSWIALFISEFTANLIGQLF